MKKKEHEDQMKIVYLDEFMTRVYVMCKEQTDSFLFVGCIGNKNIFVIDLQTNLLNRKLVYHY
jgi:hypothetical protein